MRQKLSSNTFYDNESRKKDILREIFLNFDKGSEGCVSLKDFRDSAVKCGVADDSFIASCFRSMLGKKDEFYSGSRALQNLVYYKNFEEFLWDHI